MKQQHCSNCIFSSWYHNFKDITFKSSIIPLPPDFINYLKSDGIILPDVEEIKYSNELEGYSDDEDHTWNNPDESTSITPVFPQLKEKVDAVIKNFDGAVFPKLNWSCPKDAAWINHNGTLKCTSFNDICLLLKSSDFITHDLTVPYEYCEQDAKEQHPIDQYELVIREWREMIPGMEFRCFVKDHKLVGISQRHDMCYFEYLTTNKDNYLGEIIDFYNSKIKERFADSSFVFDIYKKGNQYYLVDFNPFGQITDSLLFSWDELFASDNETQNHTNKDFFRVVTSHDGIQPSPMVTYAMPKDIIDLKNGEDINKMVDFLNLNNLISKPGDLDDE